MAFAPLHHYLPELAQRETRSITIFPGSGFDLPSAEYTLAETFCTEPGCDCRRVLFAVVSTRSEKIEAVVSYGWESRDFYAQWFRYADALKTPEMISEMQGPALNPLGPCSKHAPAILEMVKQIALPDVAYVERVKRHYALFREKIDVKMNRRQRRAARRR